ncbi:MAG: hypothetical protein H0X26_07865 [Alphaproteobacteria bacterium]|nr:hypothetical protein [Alphaproteobacteria bacterium]
MAYRGGYEFQSDLAEDKKMPSSEEGRFIYSDGKHIYWPKITQELWKKDDNSVSFFIASRSKDELSDRLSFLDSEVRFPEGLYHLQSVKDEEYRHTEKWKRLGEEDAESIFISSSVGVGSIPGMGAFAPHENPNNEDDLQVIKLQTHIKEIMERTRGIAHGPHKGSNKIIVLGPSRHGKSNLIHALADQHLHAMDDSNEGFFIDPVRIFPGFAISHTREVGTTFPCSWYDPHQNVVYWDCPGFGDPRGPIADITNLFAIRQLFENSPGAKIVLVVQQSAMAIGNSEFKDLLNQITALFPDENLLHESLSFVVTKKERGNPHVTLRNIHENLQKGSSIGFTPSAQNLLAYLVDHPERISSFSYPQKAGKFLPNTTEMWEAINKSKFLKNQQFNLHLQSDAENLIERASKKLNQSLIDYLKTEGAQKILNYCTQLIGDYCGPVSGLRQQFKTLMENIRSLRNISSEKPMAFFNRLNRFFDGTEIKKIIEHIGFLHSIKSDVVYNVEAWSAALINHTEEKIKTLIAAPQIEFSNGIMSLKGVLIGSSDLTAALMGKLAPKTINVWGLNSLFIDADFLSAGTSCSFLSPRLKVIGDRMVNLSGINGTDGSNGTHEGADGEPGGPGGNGGNVYSKAYMCDNLSHLSFDLRSGNGGRGGDGVKGSDGTNGINGDHTAYTQNNSQFVVHGRAAVMFNSPLFSIRTYNAQGTDGTDGKDGGKAGHGGKAGLSGLFQIDKSPGTDARSYTQNGIPGPDGIPGTEGKGGAHGKHACGTKFINNITGADISAHHNNLRQPPPLPLGHQERIPTHANNGTIPTGFNAVNQQEPTAQENVNNGQFTPDYINSLRADYKAYYNQEARNPNVSPFVSMFPNL